MILNQDGTQNSPSNPARVGEKITLYATGVGAVSFTQGYAVTANPVAVLIDDFWANGVAAVMGPMDGYTGDVYRLTAVVPDPRDYAASNPNLLNFKLPPLVDLVLKIATGRSQNWLSVSIGY